MFWELFDSPSAERFADLVVAEMRRQGVTGAIQYDPATCSVTKADGTQVFLATGYAEYCAAPFWQRQDVVRRYSELHRVGPREEAFEDVRLAVLPTVVDRLLVENTKRINPRLNLGGRVIAEHLVLLLAVAYPDRLEWITAADRRAWGLSFEQVLSVAKDNLWERSTEEFAEATAGVFVSPWRDQHDASRLSLTGLVPQLPVRGEHVVSVPNANTLLVTGSEDEQGLVQLAQLTEKALATEPHPMTGVLMILRGDGWAVFLPPPTSPAYRPVRMLAVQSRGREYTEQRVMLEAENAIAGRQVRLAPFAVLEHPEKGLLTWCNWVEGERAWLPRTDLLAFVRRDASGEPEVLGFAWRERVLAVVGPRLKPLGMYPDREEVTTFPDAAQLEAMRLERF